SVPTGTPPPAPVAVQPAAPATATPVTATPAGPVAPGGSNCRSGELTLKRIATDAGAGNRVATFALTSVAPKPCTLAGYPTLTLFDASGRTLPIRVVQTEQNYFESGGPAAPVTVAPNGRAVFYLAWNVVPSTEAPCMTATRAQVTPPGGDQALEVEERIEACGGQVRVSPIRAELAPAKAVRPPA
ncbi:DUF4232 domain-containing protein, partial [Caulobacter sp. 17J65-9]|uniref:DUF4232 domain-containing protein n=1 Tax=Caulobacter sp. 17J65-9 TaxID=2709382 RepID=UPI0013C72F53